MPNENNQFGAEVNKNVDPIKQKTNWILYTITVIISFGLLAFLNASLSLSTSFLPLPSFAIIYVLISIFSW